MFKVAERDNPSRVYTVYGMFEKYNGLELYFILWDEGINLWRYANADHFVPVGE